jgi:cytochrome c oxidase assembly factor CtaG
LPERAGQSVTDQHPVATIAPVPGNDPDLHWLPNPFVLAPIVALAVIYVRRFRRARAEEDGRGAGAVQAAFFAAGIATLLLAVASPLDRLGEDNLSA